MKCRAYFIGAEPISLESTSGIACAAYHMYTSAVFPDFLGLAKNRSFLLWKHNLCQYIFMDAH